MTNKPEQKMSDAVKQTLEVVRIMKEEQESRKLYEATKGGANGEGVK